MLAKNPARRTGSVEMALAELDQWVRGPAEAIADETDVMTLPDAQQLTNADGPDTETVRGVQSIVETELPTEDLDLRVLENLLRQQHPTEPTVAYPRNPGGARGGLDDPPTIELEGVINEGRLNEELFRMRELIGADAKLQQRFDHDDTGGFEGEEWDRVVDVVGERLRREDEAALVDLEAKFQGHLTFVSDAHFHMEEFSITNDDNGKVLFSSVDS